MQYAQERSEEGGRLRFKVCQWPPPTYAQADGYSDVTVTGDRGPGTYEATDANYADRIVASCKDLQLAYSYQNMGVDEHQPPFAVSSGAVVTVLGKPWVTNSPAPLPFYPNRGDVVVLRNSKYRLDFALCVGG
jgi:hypothetical protein